MIKIIEGDLLDANTDFIAHQVNCQGAFNSGVARAIREYDERIYKDYCTFVRTMKEYDRNLLGQIFVSVNYYKMGQLFVHMFAQNDYGYDGKQYTDITSFRNCIQQIKHVYGSCVEDGDGNKRPISIAFPYKVGCVRGGADWDVIYNIIKEELSDQGYNVEFWKLDLG